MHALKQSLAVAAAVLLLSACEPIVTERAPMPSGYSIGETLAAPVGGVVMSRRDGQIEKAWVWHGLFSGAWVREQRPSKGHRRREIIFSGVEGSTAHFHYREFVGGNPQPATAQEAHYDLAQSRIITFRNFTIEVQEANNRGFVGRLLSDLPGYVPASDALQPPPLQPPPPLPNASTAAVEAPGRAPPKPAARPAPRPVPREKPQETHGLPSGIQIIGPR